MLAGRLVALLALACVALGVAGAVKLLGGRAWDALLAAVLGLGWFAAFATHYVAMDDPQMLAHALTTAGLVAYLWSGRQRNALWVSAALFALGLFIKYNVVALPAAVGLHLLLRAPKRFLAWAGVAAGLFIALLLAAYGAWGMPFVHQLTMNLVSWDVAYVVTNCREMGRNLAIPLLVLLPWALWTWRPARPNSGSGAGPRLRAIWADPRCVALFYLLSAAAVGIWTSGGSGSDVNMFFDLFVALALAAGLFSADLRAWLGRRTGQAALVGLALPLLLGASILAAWPLHRIHAWTLSELRDKELAAEGDVAFLAERSGPAICETLVLCYYAGKPFDFDPYNASEMMMRGLQDEAPILERLEEGYYGVVQLNKRQQARYSGAAEYTEDPERQSGRHQRFTENFRIALAQNYVLARQTDQRSFYVPKRPVERPLGSARP